MKDRFDEAKQILIRLHASSEDSNNEFANAEFYQIQKQIAIDKTLGNTWMYMIRKPSYRKRCLLAIGTTAIIQCSGVLVINSKFLLGTAPVGLIDFLQDYGPTLYANLGFSTVKQLLYPAAWLTLTLGINIMAMATVDLFPRNLYMGFGVLGCMVTLIIEAALVAEFVPSDNQSALLAAVAMLFIFQIFYGFCLDGRTLVMSI